MFCVDKIKYEHLAILSNLKSCQFAARTVIFNLYVANLRIHWLFCLKQFLHVWAIATFNCDKWGLIFGRKFFPFLSVHNLEFLENLIKKLFVSEHILMWSSAERVKSKFSYCLPYQSILIYRARKYEKSIVFFCLCWTELSTWDKQCSSWITVVFSLSRCFYL